MKVLQVIDQAFRTTTEEQDDTIIWLTRSMVGAGADLALLLSGHASYYAVQSRRQPALQLGEWQQSQPAEITADINGLVNKQIAVYAVREDLAERGLEGLPLQPGIELVDRAGVAALYDGVDQVWHW